MVHVGITLSRESQERRSRRNGFCVLVKYSGAECSGGRRWSTVKCGAGILDVDSARGKLRLTIRGWDGRSYIEWVQCGILHTHIAARIGTMQTQPGANADRAAPLVSLQARGGKMRFGGFSQRLGESVCPA